jgi:hypothetical protein
MRLHAYDQTCLCVYGAASFKGKTLLVFVTGKGHIMKTHRMRGDKRCKGVGAEEYINVMATHLIPDGLKLHGDKLVYMHDWFGCHASQLVKTLTNMMLGCMSWSLPSRSPDIDIIENVWARIDSQLRKRSYNTPYIAFKQS